MITGTIRYSADDLRAIETAFGRGRTLPLWLGALVLSLLGGVIGLGAAVLLERLALAVWAVEVDLGGWSAFAAATLLVAAGAYRLTHGVARSPPATAQSVVLDATGVQLSTEKAESLMRWPLFADRVIEPDRIMLLTEDRTVVLLRPAYFADPAAFAAARRLVAENVVPRVRTQ